MEGNDLDGAAFGLDFPEHQRYSGLRVSHSSPLGLPSNPDKDKYLIMEY